MGEISWLLLAFTLFAGAASPGPSLALVMRHAMRAGPMAGLQVALAHGLGVWIYALAVVFGVATVLLHMQTIMLAIQLAGIVFLCYLGTLMIRGGLNPDPQESVQQAQDATAASTAYFRDGFLIVFLNPKIVIFFLAVFSQFLTPTQPLLEQVFAATLAGLIDGLWYATVAMLVGGGLLSAWLQRHQSKLDIVFGLVLWGVSASLVYGIFHG